MQAPFPSWPQALCIVVGFVPSNGHRPWTTTATGLGRHPSTRHPPFQTLVPSRLALAPPCGALQNGRLPGTTSGMPAQRKSGAAYLREWRDYRARHGSVPTETSGCPGYALATRIRWARVAGKFTAAELAELDAPPLPSVWKRVCPHAQTSGGITASGCTIPAPAASLPAAAAKTHTPPATGPEGEAAG